MKYFFTLYLIVVFMAVFLFPQAASATIGNESVSESRVSVTPEAMSPTPTCASDPCVPSQIPTGSDTEASVASTSSEPKVTISPTSTPAPTSVIKEATTSAAVPSITPDPTIMQMRQELNNNVSEKVDAALNQIKHQEVALSHFFASIQNFFASLF